jgi:uncharacterized membrane protein
MRPAGEDPDGRPRRQPQRGDCRGGDGVRRQGKLALTERRGAATVVSAMKKILVPLLLALGGCASVPVAPAQSYHAVGTEPFWSLVIGDREISFTQPEQQPVVQPKPRAIVGFAGEIYQTPRIDVNIVHAQCSDGMSDRVYPDKVQVRVDGKRFSGCGGL